MAVITAVDRKALRDLWHMKGQAVAIALVIGCGVALFTLSRSMLHSLELTQITYYQRFHFAEVFASLKRAPDALRERIAEISKPSNRNDLRKLPFSRMNLNSVHNSVHNGKSQAAKST